MDIQYAIDVLSERQAALENHGLPVALAMRAADALGRVIADLRAVSR